MEVGGTSPVLEHPESHSRGISTIQGCCRPVTVPHHGQVPYVPEWGQGDLVPQNAEHESDIRPIRGFLLLLLIPACVTRVRTGATRHTLLVEFSFAGREILQSLTNAGD